jgi:6-phospho-3-hexuloisomerase
MHMQQSNSKSIEATIEQVTVELSACLRHASGDGLLYAATLIESAPRIFVAGAGRTGLVMRAFGMRLMQLGKSVYVVGETTTPSIRGDDLLICGSGSGRTATMLQVSEIAHRQGVQVLLFTTDAASPLADLADHLMLIAAPPHKGARAKGSVPSLQPLGTLFEQSLLILGDTLILELMQRLDVDASQMAELHDNLQ